MIEFEKYDSENPHLWDEFKKFAHQAKSKGFKNYGAKGIFEIMRWHTAASGNCEFKINNNYAPDYARKMMRLHPEFEGFFRIKSLKASRAVQSVDDNGQYFIL